MMGLKKKVNRPKMHWHWLNFLLQLPKDLVLELTGKPFSCSEHISLGAIVIWPRIHFPGQRLMHWLQSTIIFHKKFPFEVPIGEFC